MGSQVFEGVSYYLVEKKTKELNEVMHRYWSEHVLISALHDTGPRPLTD